MKLPRDNHRRKVAQAAVEMSRDVVGVECLDDQRLLLTFEGGERREGDIAALVPFDDVFEPLKDAEFFHIVSVNPDVGTIDWPDSADICPDMLYERSLVMRSFDE